MSLDEAQQQALVLISELVQELEDIILQVGQNEDFGAAQERLTRWKERAVRRVSEGINRNEGERLAAIGSGGFIAGKPLLNFVREADDCRSFLLVLAEEIKKHPEDVLLPSATAAAPDQPTDAPQTAASQSVFIVHGHDEGMKQAVARTLEKLDFDPIILHEKPDQGRTIIEKLSDYDDVGFAVILLSPDDMAYPKGCSPEDARPRARQNVLLELGYFINKLGRKNVVALYREEEDFEWPSDYSGVLHKPYDESGHWQLELVKELKAAKYAVDANKLV